MFVFFSVPSDLGFLIFAFCFLLFLRWLIIYINKPYSPSGIQLLFTLIVWGICCVYPFILIMDYDHKIYGYTNSPDGVGVVGRLFALILLLFGWLVPFGGFGLYNKKQLK